MATAEKKKASAKTTPEAKVADKEETMDTSADTVVDHAKLAFADIERNVTLLRESVKQHEPRYSYRALRKLNSLRKRLTPEVLAKALNSLWPATDDAESGEDRALLLKKLGVAAESSAMDTEEDASPATNNTNADIGQVEVQLYLHLLTVILLLDQQRLDEANEVSTALVTRIDSLTRRSAHVLGARAFFFHARICELTKTLSASRGMFQRALRKASLANNEDGQAVIINALLRSLLQDRLYDQADLLVSKTDFPESAQNAEAARYQYYLGRIKAIQLDYSEAYQHLIEATRKAPSGASGFLQHVHKVLVIVQLLMGDIPERELFRRPALRKSLEPYYQLTHAVRRGDLRTFNQVVQEFGAKFKADETFTLIMRLRHSVIKTGVRKLSLSYSRLSLADVAAKLHLESADEAEYIVAKAIGDGVIDAQINHAEQYMTSQEVVDLYATGEPQEAFHQRINFCLKVHRDSVKALRFAPNAYRKHLNDAEELELEEDIDVSEDVEVDE